MNRVITLKDGFRITDINCNICGSHSQITNEDVTFIYCSGCNKKHLNIAYYYINKDGILDFNEYYWNEKKRK